MNPTAVRILCIEDNPMNWRLVQRLLSQAGYDMHWAEDGLRGFDSALALKPALILLDINLPGLSGFEVATKLRQSEEMRNTLIVALTAKTLRSDRETALVTGCDGFISKPIDPFLFVSQVEAYLGGHRDQLEQGREGAALRQFTQEVVKHLEAQLREAQESNQKLLEAQGQLEQRSHHLSSLLSLSKDIISIRNRFEIQERVLGQLQRELNLDQVQSYLRHDSGAYFRGLQRTTAGFQEAPVLPAEHLLPAWVGSQTGKGVWAGTELRKLSAWEQGIELGLWSPRAWAILLPLRSRSGDGDLSGLLALDRAQGDFQPFEIELVALYAEILQVSLENAELISHLDEASQALSTSYESMEIAYEDLVDAQRALGTQNQKTALGGLFLNVAQRLLIPVRTLQEESARLAGFLGQPAGPAPEDRADSHHAIDQIQGAVAQVDSLVTGLLSRTALGQASIPGWLHLHELLRQEVEFLLAGGILPAEIRLNLDFQAPADRLFGVHLDFAEILLHSLEHCLVGQPGMVTLRTKGESGQFLLEVEDDGMPIEAGLLEGAFEPFPQLRAKAQEGGRHPGPGLPACVQLLAAYGGSIAIPPREKGSLLQLVLPMP